MPKEDVTCLRKAIDRAVVLLVELSCRPGAMPPGLRAEIDVVVKNLQTASRSPYENGSHRSLVFQAIESAYRLWRRLRKG